MELKGRFNKTSAGLIPADWRVSRIGEEFEIKLGKMLDAGKNSGLMKPYLGNKAVQWNAISMENLPFMAMSPADTERYRLRQGDILVCEGGEVGRAAIWEAPIDECYYQKALHRLRPINGFNPKLLVAFLQYWVEHGYLDDYVTRTSIAHLTKEKFAQIPMPVPGQEEQKAITAALSDIEALLASLDTLIAKKRRLKQAVMQATFSLASSSNAASAWSERPLGYFAETRTGPFGAQLHERDYVEQGTPIITVEHIGEFGVEIGNEVPMVSEGDAKRLERYKLLENDIVFSRVGSIDRNAIVTARESGWLFSGRLLRVRPSPRINPAFLSYYFQNETFKRHITSVAVGQTMPSLNTKILSSSPVKFPPLMEQQSIVATLSDMDSEIAALESRRNKTRALKQGMMQELLSGRVRLL
jgi:type I restriction enzyme S subunit